MFWVFLVWMLVLVSSKEGVKIALWNKARHHQALTNCVESTKWHGGLTNFLAFVFKIISHMDNAGNTSFVEAK